MTLEFGILGPLEVRDDGRLLEIRRPRQRLVLAVLLLRAGEVVSKEALIDALWGDDPVVTADKTVQMHVSHLRRALGPGGAGVIATRPGGYRIDPERLDLAEFERELAAAASAKSAQQAVDRLGDALALWRGPPLSDVEAVPALRPDIARLEELRLGALEDRIAGDIALGRHAEVVAELEALVARHRLRERPNAQLMLALYRSGRQADALAAYRAARAALVDELGIEPGRELRELEGRILAQDPALDPPPRATTGAQLVGRDRELAELLARVDAALAGQGSLTLIGGEPGIGKSCLADVAAGYAADRGATVLVGRCWEAGGAPPYWPWVQALDAYVRDADPELLGAEAADLGAIVPALAAPPPPSDSEGGRFRLFAAVAAFLRRAASSRPVALFLDDLHAADPPSLALLRFIAAELARAPLLVVGCFRDTEVSDPLGDTLADVEREPSVHRLALRGLTDGDIARLLEGAAGARLDADVVRRVQERCEGNALFALESARLLASGVVEPGAPLPISERVTGVIAQRVRGRSPRCREVLLLASVIGREFPVELLAAASGLAEDELFAALEEAEEARLVGAVPGAADRLRFSHMLVRDALYEELPLARRLPAHQRVAEALERIHARHLEPHLAELAHHFLRAGPASAQRALDYATRAGDRATRLYGYEEAAEHYRRALRVLETTAAGDAGRTCELLLSLGEVLGRAGSEREAKATLAEAARLAEQQHRPDVVVRAAVAYGISWARAGSDPALLPLLERALAIVGDGDPRSRVLLLARLAAARRDDVRRAPRMACASEALALARELGDEELVAVALEARFNAIESAPDVAQGLKLTAQLVALAARAGDRERECGAREHCLNVVWSLGDRHAVDAELAALSRLAEELRQGPQRWIAGSSQAALALMEGRLEDAERLVEDTYALGRDALSFNAAVSERMQRFVLAHERGRLQEVEDTLRGSADERGSMPRFACALAHLRAELGRTDEARTGIAELLERTAARVDPEWLFSLVLLADPCASVADAPLVSKLRSLLLPHEGMYAQSPDEAAFGSVARALGVLAAAARDFDAAAGHFTVSLDVERRMRARPWLAHAQRDFASMLIARAEPEDPRLATQLLSDAQATYDSLGMAHWEARCAELRLSAQTGVAYH